MLNSRSVLKCGFASKSEPVVQLRAEARPSGRAAGLFGESGGQSRQPERGEDFHLPGRAASANLAFMKFLARLATGNVALWCVFWLIGIPLALVWDFSGGCMLAGCGVGQPLIAGFLVVLFMLSSLALVFVAVAIWRSSSRYPREAWWQSLLAIGAKLCAVLSGFAAAVSFLIVAYLVFDFIYAGVLPV